MLLLGTSVDWEVSLQLSSVGPTNTMPPGWYFTPAGQDGWKHPGLFGNVQVNGLNEWNVDKLGWYKSTRRSSSFSPNSRLFSNGHVSLQTFQQIKRSLNVHSDNCAQNDNRFHVKKLFSKLLSVEVNLNRFSVHESLSSAGH